MHPGRAHICAAVTVSSLRFDNEAAGLPGNEVRPKAGLAVPRRAAFATIPPAGGAAGDIVGAAGPIVALGLELPCTRFFWKSVAHHRPQKSCAGGKWKFSHEEGGSRESHGELTSSTLHKDSLLVAIL